MARKKKGRFKRWLKRLRGRFAYTGASKATRVSRWNPTGTSADTEILAAGPIMRDRTRDLYRNNPHARRFINVITSRLIGTGIRPRFKTGDSDLDKLALALWEAQGKVIYSASELGVYGVEDVATRAAVNDGGSLLRRRFRRMSDGLPVPFQVQIMEIDYLDVSKDGTLPNGGRIVGGVEFDPLGRRKAYWLFKEHPGDQTIGRQFSESIRVKASEIIHMHKEVRPGQVGDVPWLHACITALKDHGGYKDAERLRKWSEACLVLTITGGDDDLAPPGDNKDGLGPTPLTDADGNPIEELSAGLVSYAPEGREVVFNTPKSIGGFAENMSVDMHEISAGADVPYEMATQDLSKVNFSSIRMGGIQFRLEMKRHRELYIVPTLCEGLMTWFLEAAIVSGALPDRDYPVEWSEPRIEEVDRLKDAQADILELRAGLTSPRRVLNNRGLDFQTVAHEIKEDRSLWDELKLVFDSDSNKTTKSGDGTKEAEETNEEEETEGDDARPTDGSNALTLSK